MLSWPFSSGRQPFPCIPTTTSAGQASVCVAARAAGIHRHPHHTGSDQNSSEATVISSFHQVSTQGASSRHVKVVPELASLSNASASHVPSCVSLPECCSPPSKPQLLLSKKVTAAGQRAAWQKEFPPATWLHAEGWVKPIP